MQPGYCEGPVDVCQETALFIVVLSLTTNSPVEGIMTVAGIISYSAFAVTHRPW